MSNKFDVVSVLKKSAVHYGGRSISRTIQLQDGTQKTLGVFLPSEHPLVFQTYMAEKIEITSGLCQVQIGLDQDYRRYREGQIFAVPKNSQFKIICSEIVDYVCHFDE